MLVPCTMTVTEHGSIKIASCIKHGIDNKHVNDDFTHLIVILDRCAHQNKSINLVMFHQRELHSLSLTSMSCVPAAKSRLHGLWLATQNSSYDIPGMST